MPGNSRRHIPFDRDLELLPRPIPGWDAEWIHLGHGPVSNDAMRVTFGSGSFAVFQTSSAGILRGTNAADTVAFLGSLPATNLPRSHAQPIGSDAASRCRRAPPSISIYRKAAASSSSPCLHRPLRLANDAR